ncbi:MAG: uncharacterized membrane protein YjgN (DUF898 family) [Myxococcota bacterium]|jgi:uncharacterized membrane protein YjgN (DUF898 family)
MDVLYFIGPRQIAVLGLLAFVTIAVIIIIIVLPLRALLDVSRRTDAEFEAIGEQRRTWLVAMLAATLLIGPGWLAAFAYLRTVKPRLTDA